METPRREKVMREDMMTMGALTVIRGTMAICTSLLQQNQMLPSLRTHPMMSASLTLVLVIITSATSTGSILIPSLLVRSNKYKVQRKIM